MTKDDPLVEGGIRKEDAIKKTATMEENIADVEKVIVRELEPAAETLAANVVTMSVEEGIVGGEIVVDVANVIAESTTAKKEETSSVDDVLADAGPFDKY